ncbi:hypothetical protein BpHYR1_001785 [Brachionus plicatilis]|uniref:Uncharacterized protein n=1 Tax=Brachionus plicatilis TaxID=10195 RepID=A0A3M7RL28_BRAPC|nr:hypothetical protein BpHYR1_001785 [Brachionus plicatilis]
MSSARCRSFGKDQRIREMIKRRYFKKLFLCKKPPEYYSSQEETDVETEKTVHKSQEKTRKSPIRKIDGLKVHIYLFLWQNKFIRRQPIFIGAKFDDVVGFTIVSSSLLCATKIDVDEDSVSLIFSL